MLSTFEETGTPDRLPRLMRDLARSGADASLGPKELTVLVEAQGDDLGPAMQDLLKARLGVQIGVRIVAPGATAPLTQIEARQKPIRLIRE